MLTAADSLQTMMKDLKRSKSCPLSEKIVENVEALHSALLDVQFMRIYGFLVQNRAVGKK